MKKEALRKKPPDDLASVPSFECLVACLFCEVRFLEKNHLPTKECRMEKGKAKHFGFCSNCQEILTATHYRQLTAKPVRQLRLEGSK